MQTIYIYLIMFYDIVVYVKWAEDSNENKINCIGMNISHEQGTEKELSFYAGIDIVTNQPFLIKSKTRQA